MLMGVIMALGHTLEGIIINNACEDLMTFAYVISGTSFSLLLRILAFCIIAQRFGQRLLK